MPDTDRPPHSPQHDTQGDNPEVHHELSDVDVRGILIFIGGLLIAAVVIHVFLWIALEFLATREARLDPPAPPMAPVRPQLPPQPRLQSTAPEPWSRPPGPQELREFVDEQHRLLTTYEWIDRVEGTARIPIERAMDLVIDQLAVRPPDDDPGEHGRRIPHGAASGRLPEEAPGIAPEPEPPGAPPEPPREEAPEAEVEPDPSPEPDAAQPESAPSGF